MRIKLEYQLIAAFLLVLMVLAVFYKYAYNNNRDFVLSNDEVTHSYTILNEVSRYAEFISDAETNQRGFIITNNPEYLRDYLAFTDSTNLAVLKLKQLTANNAEERRFITELEDITAKRLLLMKQVTGMRVAGFEATRDLVVELPGKRTMDQIRSLIFRFRVYEEKLLNLRVRQNEINERESAFTLTLSLTGVLIILATGFYILYRSLKARQRVEDSFRKASLRIQDLYDNAPCGYYSLDENAVIAQINETLLEWTGYSKAEVIGKMGIYKLINNASIEATTAGFQAFLKRGFVNDAEIDFVRKDGTMFPVLVNGTVIASNKEDYLGSRFTVFDNTARKILQQERDSFYNFSSEIMLLTNMKGEVIRSNAIFEKILGYSKEEQKELTMKKIIHPDDLMLTLRGFKADVEAVVPSLKTENRIKAKDGTWHWISWNSVSFSDQHLTYSYGRDISERMESEEKLKQLNQELESFTYSVSHDLRAPLRFILNYGRILQDQYGEKFDEEASRLIKVMIKNADRMGQLINDLLEFSKMGRKSLLLGTYNMRKVVDDVVRELNEFETGRNIGIKLHDLPDVRSDASMIRQVWVNLISNALKYTRKKEKAEIEIGATSSGNKVIYFVRDNGTGFDMAYIDKLFNVFQRLHSEVEFEGTGVGLALVKRIITRHHGEIWAEAEKDKGATFYFSLVQKGKTDKMIIK